MANPFDQFDSPQAGPVYGPPPKAPAQRDPYAIQLDQLQIQQKQNELQTAPLETEIKRFDLEEKKRKAAQGPQLTDDEQKLAGRVGTLNSIVGQINHVDELYRKGLKKEAFGILSSLGDYLPTSGNATFDTAGAGLADQGLAAFRVPGVGTQSDKDAEMFAKANTPHASDFDSQIEEKLRNLRVRVDANRAALGLEPAQWLGQGQPGAAPQNDPTAAIQQDGQVAYDANLGGGGTLITPTQNATKTVDNPALAGVRGEYLARLQRGDGPGEIVQFLRSAGITDPRLLSTAVQQAQFRRKNPNVPIEKYSTDALDDMDVPLSATETMMNTAAQSAPGAYVMRAGNAVTGNNLDSIVGMTGGNEERARIALNDASQMHPVAGTVGDLSGGVMAAMGAEAGLARAGMAQGVGRALAADTAYGATAGAGANDGNRLQGAVQGGLAGLAGSVGGQAVAKGIGSAISPTGGRLADLYAEGVRPTPGQRFVNANDGKGISGVAGRALNNIEENLGSVPLVGSAIRGARQDARDQFQVGGFNQALREIGDKLPKGMGPGNAAHKYANQKIGAVYDKAREGMKVMADEELANDIGKVGEQVGTLAEPSIKRFEQIVQNVVLRRTGEVIDGGAYKKIQSELGKIIRGIRKSPSGDGELADALEELRGSIDGAARRHSDPEAVAALDAADRAYAKLVRIEDASQRGGVGKDSGTFSPNDLASAVKSGDTRIRSKAYNQGSALMQDYAEQGKNLTDRIPNSGSPERLAAAAVVTGGATYATSPGALGVLGVIGGLYAPGLRKITAGAMAPKGAKAKAIADAVRKQKRLAGHVAGSQAALNSGD